MMIEIAEFLLARIAEDEAEAQIAEGLAGPTAFMYDNYGRLLVQPGRVLAECEAKRAILELHQYEWMGPDDAAGKGCVHDFNDWPCQTVRLLATVYSSHPLHRDEWRG